MYANSTDGRSASAEADGNRSRPRCDGLARAAGEDGVGQQDFDRTDRARAVRAWRDRNGEKVPVSEFLWGAVPGVSGDDPDATWLDDCCVDIRQRDGARHDRGSGGSGSGVEHQVELKDGGSFSCHARQSDQDSVGAVGSRAQLDLGGDRRRCAAATPAAAAGENHTAEQDDARG